MQIGGVVWHDVVMTNTTDTAELLVTFNADVYSAHALDVASNVRAWGTPADDEYAWHEASTFGQCILAGLLPLTFGAGWVGLDLPQGALL